MKRIGVSAAVVILVLVGLAVVAPSFIDWTDYRASFEESIASATGRNVAIDGELSLSILPRPAFRINQLRIGSITGAQNDDFLAAESVDANLALGQLVAGRLKFVSINVIDPVINAEVLADGRASWQFNSPNEEVGANNRSTDADLNLAVDRLSISNGTINYVERQSDVAYQVAGVSADVSAQSLTGPFAVAGTAYVDDKSWSYELTVGVIQEERPSSFVLAVTAPDNSIESRFSGQFSVSGNSTRGSGQLKISGSDGGSALNALALIDEATPLPKPLRKSFAVSSRVNFEGNLITAEEIEIEIGNAKIDGSGSLAVGEQTQFDLSLRTGRLDLSSWLETSSLNFDQSDEPRALFGVGIARAQDQKAPIDFSLPDNLSGSMDVRADLIEWRGQIMRNGVFAASLADAELTVANLSIELPGNSSAQVTGFIQAKNGQPSLDLEGEMSSRNLRALLAWIDVEPDKGVVPPSRLNSLTMASRITGSPAQINLEGLEVTLDTTRMTGSFSYEPGARGQLSADVAVSQFNLDSYVPALQSRLAVVNGARTGGEQDAQEMASNSVNDELLAFDANILLSVGALTAAGNVVRDLKLNAIIAGKGVKVNGISVGDVAGASVALKGELKGSVEAIEFKDFSAEIVTPDLARTARALALDIPVLPVTSGPASLTSQFSGTFDALSLAVTASLGEFSLALDGQAKSILSAPSFNFESKASHPSYTAMMAGLGVNLPTAEVSPGAVTVSNVIVGDLISASISELVMSVGDNSASGSLVLNQIEGPLDVSGSVDIARAEFDSLFPPDPADVLTRVSRGRSSSGSGAVSGRWSTEPLNLSMFMGVNAALQVTGAYFSGRGLIVEDFVAPVQLSNGILEISGWQGTVYGGPSTGAITISTREPITIQSRIEIQDALVVRIGGALSEASTASGKISLTGAFATQGNSQRELVTALSGQGAFIASGLDANKAEQGAFVNAALAPVRALSQLGGLLGGGVTKGFASMGAQFEGSNGVFQLSDATIKSNVYSGEFNGTIDLPKWWIKSEGRVRLEANLITQLLGNRLQMPSLIPISVDGPLDAPNVKMDTIVGAQEQSPAPTPQPLQKVVPTQDAKPNPLDLFQGILNEIAKPQ